jgi:PAS domain-containing protein
MAIQCMLDGKYLDVNDAFVTMTGYSSEETYYRQQI